MTRAINLSGKAARPSRAPGLRLFCALALFFLAAQSARAQAQPIQGGQGQTASELSANSSARLPPEKSRPVRVPRFEKPPVIDGVLDEEVWKTAAVLKDFYQTNPGDNTRPSYPTETLLGYDSRTLYIGFRCFDDPAKVRATIAKRDGVLFTDDTVRILLDTFNDKRRAYVLVFNPLGIQQDGVRSEGADVDFSVDIVMESKGTLTREGYTVEVAVPFKSLRYEAGRGKLWGVQVFRRIERLNGEQDSWMPISRSNSSLLGQAGHITGLEGISTEHTLELIPSLTVSETGKRVHSVPPALLQNTPGLVDPGRFVNEPLKPDPGLNAKFSLTPTVTLDLAVNPDFAQVEADQLVVTTNKRFPIFFPEKRPFFLEGIEIFRTPLTAVHTRAIVDPDFAAKLTGKRGRNSFGLLYASDNGPGDFAGDDRLDPANFHFLDRNASVFVLRLKRDVGTDSNLGVIATSYNFNADKRPLTVYDLTTADPCLAEKSLERTNQLAGVDGHFRVNKITTYDFQLVGTTSRRCFFDPRAGRDLFRTGDGLAYSSTYDVTGRNFGWTLGVEGRTRDYPADVGFTERTDNNYDYFAFRYSTDPKQKARLVQWQYTSYSHIEYDFRGRLQLWDADSTVYWFLQHNTDFWVAYRRGHEKLYEEEFGPVRTSTQAGTFSGAGERGTDKNHFVAFFETQPSKTYGGSIKVAYRLGTFDFDFGGGPRFPRVSPAARANPAAPLDPGAGKLLDITGSAFYQPTNALRISLNYLKNRLVRDDTHLVAFDDEIYSLRATYQFTRFVAARARLDYTTLQSRARAQFLFAWTPNPGTALYIGYNDDVNLSGFSPINGLPEPGLRRNGRTFFVKMSYLFRRSF
ncbi:MAG TPA: DUF5916 domain-containing protein [Pyrinomonadaceae bacterium]|nr:DUF5916 domain-containing protein [Pyrinomonadaceae bacterium]